MIHQSACMCTCHCVSGQDIIIIIIDAFWGMSLLYALIRCVCFTLRVLIMFILRLRLRFQFWIACCACIGYNNSCIPTLQGCCNEIIMISGIPSKLLPSIPFSFLLSIIIIYRNIILIQSSVRCQLHPQQPAYLWAVGHYVLYAVLITLAPRFYVVYNHLGWHCPLLVMICYYWISCCVHSTTRRPLIKTDISGLFRVGGKICFVTLSEFCTVYCIHVIILFAIIIYRGKLIKYLYHVFLSCVSTCKPPPYYSLLHGDLYKQLYCNSNIHTSMLIISLHCRHCWKDIGHLLFSILYKPKYYVSQ